MCIKPHHIVVKRSKSGELIYVAQRYRDTDIVILGVGRTLIELKTNINILAAKNICFVNINDGYYSYWLEP
jgi:hypothetical protein